LDNFGFALGRRFGDATNRQSVDAHLGAPATLRKLSTIILTLALVSAAVAFAGESSPNESLPAGPAKEKAEAACLTCHEARIIVQQRLTKPAWTKEMDKMMKWGAEVDPKDREAMIDYLSENFGPDQPVYAAPRTATESKSQTKTKK
jgi:Spy/CpxP family protein refolding chaperone